MVSDVILIGSDGTGTKEAVTEAERVAGYYDMNKKDAMRIRLLTEEALGMMRMFGDGAEGEFHIEVTDGDTCTLYLDMDTRVDNDTREKLVSVSKSGENEAAKGFMGKLFDLIDRGLSEFEESSRLQAEYGGDPGMFMTMGGYNIGAASQYATWSLVSYRSNLESGNYRDDEAMNRDAWDELEKSVVASLADDVRVTVQSDGAQLEIIRKFGA